MNLSDINKTDDYLRLFASTMGVSGNEKAVTSLFEKLVVPYVDEVNYDALGNLIAHKNGKGKKVMIVAHADEIGFIVKYVDDKGFAYIQAVGGVDASILPGRELVFKMPDGNETIGVIGKLPIHLQDNEKPKCIECSDLCVDFASGVDDHKMPMVDVGCYASFLPNFTQMADGTVKSKALDDRSGLVVLLEVAESVSQKSLDYDLYLVCSVQEELGARGARTVAAAIHPDIAIAIDVTHATDYPGLSPAKYGDIKIGKGCVVTYGPNINQELNKELIGAAQRCNAKIQKEANPMPTGTDINPIQICCQGVKTALVSIPCRYMHTPVEMISTKDIKSAKDMLTEFLIK